MTRKLTPYSGVLQVHSDQCGGMPMSGILEAASKTNVDFVLMTERNATDDCREKEGWHNNTLILVDEEVVHRDGEFLALGGKRWVQNEKVLEQSISAAQRAGAKIAGVNFHLQNGSSRQSFPTPIPTDWMDLICIWSFLDEYLNRVSGDNALMFQKRPERVLYGPRQSVIQQWDQLNQVKPTPAIGCVNAYNRKDPLLEWKEFFTFQDSFKTVRTMILCDELSQDSKQAIEQVQDALTLGRSFLYNYSIGDVKDFQFSITKPDNQSCMIGDLDSYQPGSRVKVTVPKNAEIVIRRNGEAMFWGTGIEIDFPAPCEGVYRVEVYLDRRLWIMTNPIYLNQTIKPDHQVPVDFINNYT